MRKPSKDHVLCANGHHDEHGRWLPPCGKCGWKMTCGPLQHYCSNSKCAPEMHRECRICRQKVGDCAC